MYYIRYVCYMYYSCFSANSCQGHGRKSTLCSLHYSAHIAGIYILVCSTYSVCVCVGELCVLLDLLMLRNVHLHVHIAVCVRFRAILAYNTGWIRLTLPNGPS